MKKLLLLPLLFILLFSCKKDEEDIPVGSLEVKMSYYFNAFQGYKADTGADIYLYKETGKKYEVNIIDYKVGHLIEVGTGADVYPDFKAEADVLGTSTIENIPYGDYMLVAASKGRFTYSKKNITINSPTQSLVKNFGYRNEFKDEGEGW